VSRRENRCRDQDHALAAFIHGTQVKHFRVLFATDALRPRDPSCRLHDRQVLGIQFHS
jgi:hypothetical protein